MTSGKRYGAESRPGFQRLPMDVPPSVGDSSAYTIRPHQENIAADMQRRHGSSVV